MKKREIKQGEVYMCDLKDAVGSEQKGIRPCLVISTNPLNSSSPNVIIIPISSSLNKKDILNHYCLFKDKYDWFTHKNNIVLLNKIRDVSKIRLERYLGIIDGSDIEEIINLLDYNWHEHYR